MSLNFPAFDPAIPAWRALPPGQGFGRTPRAGKARLRIMIVEDESMVAWLLQTALEDAGHEIADIFASGEEAIEAFARLAPDLALLDINLGTGLDGIATAVRLRAVREIPLVFVSAYSDENTRRRMTECLGRVTLLRKPVRLDLLEETISAVAAGRDH